MKKSLATALIAALGAFALIGVSAAAGDRSDGHSAQTAKKEGKRGPRGPRGPRGFQGPAGPAGPAGIANVARVSGPSAYQGAPGSGYEVNSSTATCPPGSYVTGGGFDSDAPDNVVAYAWASATQYGVIAINEWVSSNSITAQAICARGAGLSASSRSKKTPARVVRKVKQLQSSVDKRKRDQQL